MTAIQNTHTESRVAPLGRKLGQLASFASLVKGAVDTGRTVWQLGQTAAPYVARLAPMLL